MSIFYRVLFLSILFGLTGFSWPFSWFFSPSNPEQFGSNAWIDKQIGIIKSQAGNIEHNVLRLSLVAYTNARRKGLDTKQLLTVIDYSKPSSEKRLWVFYL